MKISLKSAAAAGALLLASASLCGCKGRTAENMEPSGDTVEVFISSNADNTDSASMTLNQNTETSPMPSQELPADSESN